MYIFNRFTIQSVIFYRVNLFAMPGMQCFVYALEYKDIESGSAGFICLFHLF